eukprot:CAMPEP_0116057664 /NCGR_PEP_ID=MMETSP0322-20121206/4743_1 /TAXON_ID=163516 /ORGANISM="Leptocylindrus danicus var. apora, Strain B651" /LENGTH=350 /DNA_ID=CAMNT_0003541713 /DNA_START=135 /DNA_END=1184 /DNA_ORIENTATION=-
MTNGINFDYYTSPGMSYRIQNSVMDLQMTLENSMCDILQQRIQDTRQGAVLICDRGLMDGSAYMSNGEWESLVKNREDVGSVVDLREQRYNAVFHLVTAADGAEEFYTLENNVVRTEGLEEARVQDAKTRTAWLGHPKMCVFDNSTDFEGKLERVVAAAANIVGLPSGLHRRSNGKFVLRSKPEFERFPVDVSYQVFDVEKVYLYDESMSTAAANDIQDGKDYFEYSFVRKRSYKKTNSSSSSGIACGLTTVRVDKKTGTETEVKRIISMREYNSSVKSRDMTRHIIKQTRISFFWKLQSFVVHIYHEPVSDLCLLYCQANDQPSNSIALPPFLDVDRAINDSEEDEKKY